MTNLTLFHPAGAFRRLFDGSFPGDGVFGPLFADAPDFAPDLAPDLAPGLAPDGAAPSWTPRVDVRDTGSAVVIEADLPGVPREEIAIRFDSGTLTLEGKRVGKRGLPANGNAANGNPANGNHSADKDGEGAEPVVADGRDDGRGRWTHRERALGRFRRSFRVPGTVEVSAIRAESRDGVLTITLPKVEKALPRQIEVTVH